MHTCCWGMSNLVNFNEFDKNMYQGRAKHLSVSDSLFCVPKELVNCKLKLIF